MLSTIRSKISRVQAEIPYRIELLKHAKKLPALAPQDQAIADALSQDGVYVTTLEKLGFASTPKLLDIATSHLRDLQAAFSQTASPDANKQDTDSSTPTYPHIWTVTEQPEFATWAREQRLLGIIENYIGLPIAFQGAQLQRDFSNEKPILAELWHTDAEDRRMIKVIVYLSDVREEHGPFQCIPKSKVSPLLARHIQSKVTERTKLTKESELGINDAEMEKLIPRSSWKSCTGSAGTVIFVDTKAVFHHGTPRTKERSAIFFVYTSEHPLHPEYCSVYYDESFSQPEFMRPCPSED